MAPIRTILFFSIGLLLIHRSYSDFPTDFLGNYVSDVEYNKRNFCWTKVCMQDSGRLIYAANYELNGTAPCDDFKTFAMGNFFKHRVLNDRYDYLSFELEVYLKFFEKQKRALLKPFEKNEPMMFKVMKSFFRNCINSSLVENEGSSDVISYARSLGIVTISRDEKAVQLDVKNAMAVLSAISTRVFFDTDVAFCKEMLCFLLNDRYTFSEIYELSLQEIFKYLHLDENYELQIRRDFSFYLQIKSIIQDKFKPYANETIILTISEINQKYPSKYLDWLHMINSQLLIDSHMTLDDKILIYNPRLMEGLHKLFTALEETFIANVFAAAFITSSPEFFTPYSFTTEDAQKRGAIRQVQRFEQCVKWLELNMRPAIEALNAVSFFDPSVHKSATEMVELAVVDAIENISKNERIPKKTRKLLTQKLESVKLSVMFPDDILNLTKIEGLHNELDFTGSESLFELVMKIQIQSWKLQMQPENHWITNLHTIVREDVATYFVDQNLFYYPVIWTLYPYFDPNRSRFFNMATFYLHALDAIDVGLKGAYPKENLTDLLPQEEMTYRSYVKWELNGGVDLQLPSFKLTNRQMVWVCMLYSLSKKFHRNTPKKSGAYVRITNNNLNAYLKRTPGFREAFQCGELTEIDERQIEELQKQRDEFFRKYNS